METRLAKPGERDLEDMSHSPWAFGGRPWYNPAMTTMDRIRAAAETARQRGEHPRRVFLTVDDGRKLQFELISTDRHLGHRIIKDGIRHAVHKIEGLEVVWRSPEFKVT